MRNTARGESRFDERYYSKWYDEDLETRREIAENAAKFVLAYVEHMDSSVESVLDLGCGLGLWRDALQKRGHRIRYTGVEYSSHLCRKMGWQHGDVRTYSSRRRFDLVVCQGVLQYLSDAECEGAIANLSRLCRRFLFLEVLTAADAKEVCAPDGTDLDVHVREAGWYRQRLAPHFLNLGGGLYATPAMRPHLYELWYTAS